MAGPANAVYTTFYDAAPQFARGATPSTKARGLANAMPCATRMYHNANRSATVTQ